MATIAFIDKIHACRFHRG